MLLSQIVKNQKQTFGLIRVSNEEKLFILKFSGGGGGVITVGSFRLRRTSSALCKSSFV